jgi:hypothetical protein
VGAQDARPESLEGFLRKCSPQQAYDVAAQIAAQVEQLGELRPENKSVQKVFWTGHDAELLKQQWERIDGPQVLIQSGSSVDPIALYAKLRNDETKVQIKECSLVHGDLHVRNVALDVKPDGSAEAYIFDPGVGSQNVAGRDLAVLEVSLILHQRISYDVFVQICALVYGLSGEVAEKDVSSIKDPVGRNVVEFIRALRRAAPGWNEPPIYVLMVFDSALIQLGGLAYGSSGNMIADSRAVAHLLTTVAAWYAEGVKSGQFGKL